MNIHKHLVFTGVTANAPRDPEYIRQAMLTIVDEADMEVFMPPQAKYCEDPSNAGVTGTVVITTSHSSVHIWDKGLVQADLYSCKDFDVDHIAEVFSKLFKCEDYDIQVMDRRPSSRLQLLLNYFAMESVAA